MDAFAPAIEDYALIGDGQTAALVSRNGSIDWLCWPRFDSPACLAALLGTRDNGFWHVCPRAAVRDTRRSYLPGTMILRTVFTTGSGRVALTDFMPLGTGPSTVVRLVEGLDGRVDMRMRLAPRFGYGRHAPSITALKDGSGARADHGPEAVVLRASVPLAHEAADAVAAFPVEAGQVVSFVLSHADGAAADGQAALRMTEAAWRRWSAPCPPRGPHGDAVQRSALVLKSMIHAATGGIIAAPTTSLPEQLGGSRNWDYRYCWLRDASVTAMALLRAGCQEEALGWCRWLRRTIGDQPEKARIIYAVGGEAHQPEHEIGWLAGYQGARPVRVGNAAAGQFQIDMFGDIADLLHAVRAAGLAEDPWCWDLQHGLADYVASVWDQPDEGIWEVRGGRRHFTHSKVMAWVALDRAIRDAEAFGLAAPLAAWRAERCRIHAAVCAAGYQARHGHFTQTFGGTALDASLLRLPLLGFLPAGDARITGTIAAIERHLMADGLVLRYRDDAAPDGLPAGEGAFLLCGFWMVEVHVLQGRIDAARALFERLLSVRNDVGLLAEEYDPRTRRLTGNFPQGFSHAGLIAAACRLAEAGC